ncbi:hypothetical protein SETIT_8G251100v2 [Setaria italica]|uniref:Cyclin-like domain-containing protein n=3 Tax=Setaria italica TaxID=4555 RepID=A0A368SD93_SETIT|nr:hypothetical protein SETIT_8G251100v2 [Setaria italica]
MDDSIRPGRAIPYVGPVGMEDDEEGSMLLHDDASDLLYCDEDPLLVSTPPPADGNGGGPVAAAAASVVGGDEEELGAAEQEEVLALLEHMVGRQGCYAPSRGYLEHLRRQQGAAGVAAARSRGVHYIIYAFGRLGLAAATAFNAVNYLDRFLSINCHLKWEEAWMVELVSVACLSIACKLDEVNIPSLHDLQMEEVLGHWFRAATVRDMELALLKALQWRLACVTPYSFLQLIITTATTARCATRLLIRSLAEPSLLLRFDPSVIAASALRCVNQLEQDRHQLLHGDIISRLVRPHCPTDEKDADECLRMMQAIYASCSLDFEQQCSPVSVTHNTAINRSAVSRRRLFGGGSSTPPPQEGSTATTQDDDGGNN